jgi:Delta7-sterol 5-desaturase
MATSPYLGTWSFDGTTWQMLSEAFVTQLFIDGVFYISAAGLFWLVLDVWARKHLAHRLISQWPTPRDVRRELAYSASTLLIFASLGVVTMAGVLQGQLVIYREPGQYGLWWLLASLPLLLIWHDAYFYATHRLLHTRLLFRYVHAVHHRSRQPSPWASYSFHPLDALVNGLPVPLALFVLPLHWSVLLLFSLIVIVRNAHGHAAVETMPRGFTRHVLSRHLTTTTHHHLHHETVDSHFGIWFTWWDRWFRTERADYHARFDAATPLSLPADPAASTQEPKGSA